MKRKKDEYYFEYCEYCNKTTLVYIGRPNYCPECGRSLDIVDTDIDKEDEDYYG